MILHACLHWNNGIDSSLWPMDVKYVAHVYTQMPKLNGVWPADFFSGYTVPRHRLLDLHVWGCPVYVLDPKLQQGQKLPRWQPRSRQGIFMGLTTQHASNNPLVLNCKTGSITTQFHVVFDDLFRLFLQLRGRRTPPVIGKNFVWKTQLTFSSKIHRFTFKMTGSLTKNAKTCIVKIRGSSPFALLNCDVINLIYQAPQLLFQMNKQRMPLTPFMIPFEMIQAMMELLLLPMFLKCYLILYQQVLFPNVVLHASMPVKGRPHDIMMCS
jgi:hypothetical protein